MNAEYQRAAYKRSVFITLRRILEDKYLEGGGGVKEEIICEILPYDMRVVPNETIVDVIQTIQEEERVFTEELAQFSFERRQPRPIGKRAVAEPEPEPEAEQPASPPRKPRAKPRRTGGGE